MSPADLTPEYVVILDTETDSGEIDLRGKKMAFLHLPVLDGLTLTFEAAEKPTAEGGTYLAVIDDAGAAVTVTHGGSGGAVVLSPEADYPRNCMLKIILSDAQTADRTFPIIVEPF